MIMWALRRSSKCHVRYCENMAKKKAPKFDKAKSIPDLSYEYGMLIATAALVHDGFSRDQVLINSVMESFGVHARNLHEFFQLEKKRDGDYRARCFVDGFKRTVLAEDTVDKINWWLQHLTTWRYDKEKKPQWDVVPVVSRVYACMDDFLKCMDDLLNEQPSDQDLLKPLEDPHRAAKAFLERAKDSATE